MLQKIKNSLALLNEKNDDHWTEDGLPRLDVVIKLSGVKDARRSDVNKAGPNFSRTNMVLSEEKFSETDLIEKESENDFSEKEKELQKALEVLKSAQELAEKATRDVFTAQKAYDSLVEEREKNVNPNQNQLDIMEFIKSQQKLREQKARAAIEKASISSALDNSMSKKSLSGQKRPEYPLLGKNKE